ncbi:hypothetical protein [Pararhodobacter sp.]|uniref:hypothetical protein n=1 Tax=Pararhodobacter sp. TaxID=2127056 RepID=UPI002FE25460|nr:hypothetical protein [Pseudomonadota bacterium]
MSKSTIGVFAGALALAVLGGCSHFHHQQEEYVAVEPAPQPIYVEPVAPKYR